VNSWRSGSHEEVVVGSILGKLCFWANKKNWNFRIPNVT